MTRTLFLVPGVYGDEADLARFRQLCEPDLHFVLVELPDIDETAVMLRDMVQTSLRTAQAIASLQPTGPLRIAGYSFGGSVAVEAARYLAEHGREIRLVALLDPFIPEPTAVAQIFLGSSGGRRLVWRGLIPFIDWDSGRRHLMQVAGLAGAANRRIVRRRLLWALAPKGHGPLASATGVVSRAAGDEQPIQSGDASPLARNRSGRRHDHAARHASGRSRSSVGPHSPIRPHKGHSELS